MYDRNDDIIGRGKKKEKKTPMRRERKLQYLIRLELLLLIKFDPEENGYTRFSFCCVSTHSFSTMLENDEVLKNKKKE